MRRLLVISSSIVLFVLFLFGVAQLLRLRFSIGDVYPFYSSLRSDPLGAKLYYESLGTCCGLQLQRNYQAFSQIKRQTDSVVLVLGLGLQDIYELPKQIVEDLNYFIRSGGRLVLSFKPRNATQPQTDGLGEDRTSQRDPAKLVSLTTEWSFELKDRALPPNGVDYATLVDSSDLPEKISWHTSTHFSNPQKVWRAVYKRGEHPVVMERTLGKGSLVISADSYFISNEAMFRERHPALLAWLIGSYTKVIFDEYHHGVSATPGVATLARKYRLEWFLFAILLLAGLFIWKNSFPLMPPYEDEIRSEEEDWAKGKESAAGLVQLFRRNVPAKHVLSVCFDQWRKSGVSVTPELAKKIESLIEAQQGKRTRPQEAVRIYNEISRLLQKKRFSR